MSGEPKDTMPESTSNVIAPTPEKDKPNEESNSSTKKKAAENGKAKPETGPMDLEDLLNNTEKYADNGLPVQVKTAPFDGSAPIWGFFRKLKRIIVKTVHHNNKMSNARFRVTSKKKKTYEHVCLLCLEDRQSLDDAHPQGWTKALCKLNNTANGLSHLKAVHKDNEKVKEYLANKKQKEDSSGALDSGKKRKREDESTEDTGPLNEAFNKRRAELSRDNQARWLERNGIPHWVTQNPEYAAMFHLYDKNFKPIARQTYMDRMESHFDSMMDGVKKLMHENGQDFDGVSWLTLGHDMWSTINMEGALGSCIRLTTKDMETYTIATLLKKNSASHSASNVAKVLEESYQERFGVSLKKIACHVASDSTGSAANVAGNLDAQQNDCEMHVVSLALGYATGVKENQRMTTEVVGGKETKVITIVTPGGEFKDGGRMVKASRNIVNFFGQSSKRNEGITKLGIQLELPQVALRNFPDTRVSYVVMVFQGMMANYELLKIYSDKDDDFKKVWSKLSPVDVEAIREMEAVCRNISQYAVGDSQKSTNAFNSSLIPFYRKALRKYAYKKEYKLMVLGRQSPSTTLKNWPREKKKAEDFTDAGKKCLKRLQLQIDERLPPPEPERSLAVLLDPATKKFAKELLDEDPGLFEKTRSLLKEKHREVYHAVYGKKSGEGESNGSDKAPNESDDDLETPVAVDSDDDSTDDIFAVAKPVAVESNEEQVADLNKKADEVFEKWMSTDPDFNDHLFEGKAPLKFDQDGKVSFLEVMQKFDTAKYFRECGTEKYPTFSMLARIHFSRMDNAAFQERVFSIAANVQSDRQSRMAFEHLEKRTLLQANRDLLRKGII